MRRATNARIAGAAFLVYIAVSISGSLLSARATAGADIAARLANVAQHTTAMRLRILLALAESACALLLGVTLYRLTRDEDRDLALIALLCRFGEGLLSTLPVTALGLLWLATTTGANAPDVASAGALAAILLKLGGWKTFTGATLFAVGSTIFCWLFIRNRTIPPVLAWIGFAGSLLVAVCLPLQLVGWAGSPLTDIMWFPLLAFEVPLGIWLLVTGGRRRGHEVPD